MHSQLTDFMENICIHSSQTLWRIYAFTAHRLYGEYMHSQLTDFMENICIHSSQTLWRIYAFTAHRLYGEYMHSQLTDFMENICIHSSQTLWRMYASPENSHGVLPKIRHSDDISKISLVTLPLILMMSYLLEITQLPFFSSW